MKTLVLDTSVLVKLFLAEADRETVIHLFETAAMGEVRLIAPNLILYEALAVAQAYDVVEQVAGLLFAQVGFTLHLLEPTAAQWQQALKIINKGHRKSGFPSIYDAMFHAIALEMDAIFLTADQRHYAKTHTLGNIALLQEFSL